MCYLCTMSSHAGSPPDPQITLPGVPPSPPTYTGTVPGQLGHSPISVKGGMTTLNSTTDPRILWEDGTYAIILAKDFPANTGMGRSSTRKTPVEAIKASVDPARVTPAGAASANDYIKVVLADLLARPLGAGPPKVQVTGFVGRPPPKQMVASGYGSVPKGTIIPDAHFPHICGMCGGWYYQGTGEHTTPDGRCPNSGAPKGMSRGKKR